jgi:SAM-dependent methyltransferase
VPAFDRARTETVRYHEELFAGGPGMAAAAPTWLDRPSPHVLRAASAVRSPRWSVVDLGAGSGRHAVPIAVAAPAGSLIVAVDLLRPALDRLMARAQAHGVSDRVVPVLADIEQLELERGVDLLVACSVLEHLSAPAALEAVLDRCARAMAPGGIACLLVLAERREVLQDGTERPALVELDLRAEQARAAVAAAFAGWRELEISSSLQSAVETRDGGSFTLVGQMLRWTLQRPA